MTMHRRAFCLSLAGAAFVQGCTAPGASRKGATDSEIAAARYRHPGPPQLTLFTMVNNRSGAGAHTSLKINASERVVFDPAGSLRLASIPERGDVMYGITPVVADFYARAHARESYHVIIQDRIVPAEVAEEALRLVEANGPVAQAQCALSTGRILRRLPGFEAIRPTWFPVRLAEQFGDLPGTTTRRLYEDDPDDSFLNIKELEVARAREAAQVQ